jgi:hypothetical protein
MCEVSGKVEKNAEMEISCVRNLNEIPHENKVDKQQKRGRLNERNFICSLFCS